MVCSVCHQPILEQYYFCPNCGHSLKEKSMPVSFMMQIGLYALAIFLPPLGLWPGIKYAMKNNPQARWVGAITIILTLLSTVLTIWGIFYFSNSYLSQISGSLYGL
jgi:hypothetical protein